ncbi:MAG: hypothetical protein K1X39_02330 [Thermoflexales bacterium]|nr:hypothetical protein [Thermoflexales bacterium]
MRRSPERTAWTVLLAAFAILIALVVGVPATVSAVVNSATVASTTYVRLQAGRVQTYLAPATENDARVVSLEGREVDEGSVILVDPDASSQGMVTITPSDASDPTVSVLTYARTQLQVWRAQSPRFGLSAAPDETVLILAAGRAQFTIRPRSTRPARTTVITPFGSFDLGAGVHTIEIASGEARAFTREGSLIASAPTAPALTLTAGQRTTLATGTTKLVVLAPERDLIRNPRFSTDFNPWETEIRSTNGNDGHASLVAPGGEPSLLLDRPGTGLNWGRTGVFQIINENVAGRQSLRLALEFKILNQELPVCGTLGSECPLMINITYIDRAGAQREWFQGFYAEGSPSVDLPDVIRDNPSNRHVARDLNTRESYESVNLLTGELGNAQLIQRIRVYAEGHAVSTQIYRVNLLIQE